VEHAGLRTLIMMLVQNPQYEQILSPCVIAAQAVFLGSLVTAFLDKALDFLTANPMTSLSAKGVLKTCFSIIAFSLVPNRNLAKNYAR